MKIYDVISENSDLQERVGGLTQWALGGGKAASVEKLASQWADDILKAWKNGVDPKLSKPVNIPKNMARDPEVLKQALAKAKWQTRNLVARGTFARAGFKFATDKTAKEIFGSAIWGIAVAWGVGEPIIKTYNNIGKAEEAMESGHPDWTQAAVDAYARRELTWCVTQVAAVLATLGVAKFASTITLLRFFFPTVAKIGAAGAATWMSSGPGREALADWLVGESLAATSYEKYVGGMLLRGKEEIENYFKSQPSTSTTPTTGTTTTPGTTSGNSTQAQPNSSSSSQPNGPLSAKGLTGDDDDTPTHKRPDTRTGRIL